MAEAFDIEDTRATSDGAAHKLLGVLLTTTRRIGAFSEALASIARQYEALGAGGRLQEIEAARAELAPLVGAAGATRAQADELRRAVTSLLEASAGLSDPRLRALADFETARQPELPGVAS